ALWGCHGAPVLLRSGDTLPHQLPPQFHHAMVHALPIALLVTRPSFAMSATASSRSLNLLFVAQALGGAAPPIIISLGGLVGQQLSSDPTLATLPVSLYQLGLALSTLPAAWLMQRQGRRNT